MTCIEDECEHSGLYSNSALNAGDTELSFSLGEKVPEGRMRGFTLAEVLITLGIIGVVAALTIPTLMQNLDRRDRIAKVKAAYSQLSQAVAMARIEHGDLDKWYNVTNGDVFTDATEYTKYGLTAAHWVGYKYLLDQFKTVKVCPNNSCLPGDLGTGAASNNKIYYALDGTEQQLILGGINKAVTAVLQNGMVMRIWYSAADCSNGQNCSSVGFDISGSKSQNIVCKDFFEFALKSNRVDTKGDIDSLSGNFGCTTWILQNNNMDYLDEY
ncbi:prepilin-type N-terminal cleavage/methylation domain-containing protein [bacterium]|nr:prepilin-type N-terminal cleavage/methylation domain-containing protein [bacterium]